jgi:hypothetical protein
MKDVCGESVRDQQWMKEHNVKDQLIEDHMLKKHAVENQ